MHKWIADNALALVSLGLTLINLAAFVFSVMVLWKTMKVAQKQAKALDRQAERTSTPVITLRRKNFSPRLDEMSQPQLHADVLVPFQLKNVGAGTALAIHWRFKTDAGHELIKGMLPQ